MPFASASRLINHRHAIRDMVAMNETKTLDDRIDALETRLTFLDDTIETLNQTITAQWQQIDALTRQFAGLSERLREAEARAPGAANEPPPHY
jgi:SlyX protein